MVNLYAYLDVAGSILHYISLTSPTTTGGASEASFSVAASGRGVRRFLIPYLRLNAFAIPLIPVHFSRFLNRRVSAPTTCAASAVTVVSGNGVAIQIRPCPTTTMTTMMSFQVFSIYFVIYLLL